MLTKLRLFTLLTILDYDWYKLDPLLEHGIVLFSQRLGFILAALIKILAFYTAT